MIISKKSVLCIVIPLVFLSSCSKNIIKTETTVDNHTNINCSNQSCTEHNLDSTRETENEGLSELIDSFPVIDISAPDGATLSKYDAIGAYDNRIVFDCGFIRYAKPLFDNTEISPGLFNWETYEFNIGISEADNTGYFQVKEGQRLDNGLAVSKAETTFAVINVEDDNGNKHKETAVVNSVAEFSGEITIEGVLYCFPGIPEYIDVQGDLKFYPNPTADNNILVPYDMVQMPTRVVDPNRNYALIFDGCAFSLGNINDIPVDIKSQFETKDYINAKITINNLRIIYDEDFAGTICCGEIKQVEAI